jgi:hypothetical protein
MFAKDYNCRSALLINLFDILPKIGCQAKYTAGYPVPYRYAALPDILYSAFGLTGYPVHP